MLKDANKSLELLQLVIRHAKGLVSALEKFAEELKKENQNAQTQ
jgi:hypothetical protein